ncbi:MAG: glycerophosphodiester phosphodiesterase family protein, partial [Parabacteroides sp.]|nr:glycerophosphodiester phosphodiesterase family protein [Parabacteroides sp.]
MKIRNLYLVFLCLLLVSSIDAKNKTKVIAHRGYWTCDGSAQNSIKSLERAADIRVYGSEFDVHLTSDDVAVVYHDNTINNLKIQQVPYSTLKDLKLSNGE